MRKRPETEPTGKQEITHYEFSSFLQQMIQDAVDNINRYQGLLADIESARRNGYKIEYFITEDGIPGYKKTKKPPMGFNIKKG